MALIDDQFIYEQSYQEFRSLNGFFWQIPLIMMTLNGGLWYSVASLSLGLAAKQGILWFAVLANLVMIVALWRLRNVMQKLLDIIRRIEGTGSEGSEAAGKEGAGRIVQWGFGILLFVAALGAAIASCDPARHFPAQTAGAPAAEAQASGGAAAKS